MAEKTLKDKTVKGVGWSAADAFLGQGVTFLVGLVLARLLTPEEYGLIGIVTIFITVMSGIVDSGFSNALIRKQDVTDTDYSTLFYFNLAVSILMFALLYAGAPWIADFFKKPELVNLVRVMGLILIIQALSLVQNTILSRRIDFKTKTKASVVSAVTSGIIGIVMAIMGFGVWSLVAQQLTKNLMYTLSLWWLNRWWPRLKISIASLSYMWSFGWKLLVSGLLDNIWKQLYQVVVGKFYSAESLGQYTRSDQYASIFSTNLTMIVQRVSYPVLSEIQDDKERMVSGYRRIIKTTMFVTAILMISLGAVADPLLYCLIGPQWHMAATFLPLICINMSMYPLNAINLNMLQVQGRTDIFLYLEIIKKTISVVPVVIGIFVDIYWMLISGIIIGIIGFFLNSYYTGRSLGYTSWMQLRDIAPSYVIAFLIAFSVYFFKYLPVSNWVILPVQIAVGAVVFFLFCEWMKLPEYIEVKDIAGGLLKKMSNRLSKRR